MSERERFEAWARTQPRHEGANMRFLALNNAYIDFDLHGAWLAWQAARSGQAASGSSQGARSDVQNGVGQPEAPTAAPLPKGWDVIRKDDLFKTIIVIAPNGYSAVTTAMSRNPENVLRMLVEDIAHPPARSGAGSEEARDAARYRWLRPKMSTSRTVYDGHIGPWHINFPTMTSTNDGQPAEQLDTAIDAAIAGSEEGQG